MPDGLINGVAAARPTLEDIDTAIDVMTDPINDLVFGLRALNDLLGEVSDGGDPIPATYALSVVFMTQRLLSLACSVLNQQVEASDMAFIASGRTGARLSA
jgi:hypothetical protein